MRFILVFTLLIYTINLSAQEKIEAVHTPVEVGFEYKNIQISSNIKNSYLANNIYLNYKLEDKKWAKIEMLPKNGKFTATINGNTIKGFTIYYYISAVDLEENNINIFKNKDNPQVIKLIKGEKKEVSKIVQATEGLEIIDNNTKEDIASLNDEFEVFIEDDVKVKLASGKEESLFNSPLSASVLTAKEIKKAGSTSIPEALRMIPGIIVREQTPGNYDIHIRGFDYIPPKSYLPFATNSTTLLMINNRIIYNYINGGIKWEALPIDINDVERIEVIRGGASAMYGPNAATGVINIITKNFKKDKKKFVNITLVKGDSTKITDSDKGDSTNINGIMGYKKDKISIIISGNYTERKRDSTEYWGWRNGEDNNNDGTPDGGYVDNAGDIKSVDNEDKPMSELLNIKENQFQNELLSLRRYGFNIYMTHDLKKDISFHLDLGAQHSDTQNAFYETLDTFLLGSESNSQYTDFKANIFNGELHISYRSGDERVYNYPSFSYLSDILHFDLKYDFNFNSQFGNFNIRPSINYNSISYTGKGFGGEEVATARMENIASAIRIDYSILNFRLIGAGRIDKYAHNDKYIFTYQFATTVNISDIALLRVVYSRANRNPFLADAFFKLRNLNINEPRVFLGNPDLDVLTIDTAETGIRLKFSKILSFDMELFYMTGKNYDDLTFTGDIVVIDGVSRAKLSFKNMDLISKQMGITTSLDFNISIINLKLFGTIQKTDIENYNEFFLMNPANTDLKNIEHKNTPRFYGGAYLNIQATKDLNININPYYYTAQTFIHSLGSTEIKSKFILNAKINYDLTPKLSIFFTGRNILNNKNREFGYADKIGGLYLIGANINY